MKKHRVALIGFGYWGKKHYEYLKSRNDVELIYLCDKYSVDSSLDCIVDYKEIDISKIDVIDIVTSEDSHFEILDYFLNKDVSIFVEKPICIDIVELESLKVNSNSSLMVGYLFNFDLALNYYFENLCDISSISEVKLVWKSKMDRVKNCDIISDLGPHMFSILSRFSSNINILSSILSSDSRSAKIVGTLNSKIPFEIDLSWDFPETIRNVVVDSLVIDCASQKILGIKNFESYKTLNLELDYFFDNCGKITINTFDYAKRIFLLWNKALKLALK